MMLKQQQAKSYLDLSTLDQAENIKKIFKETITSREGKTVYELSKEHKIIGIFIKWYGCPMCQEVMEVVGKMFPTFIKLNTLPIIFHQENELDAKKTMENAKDLNVNYIPYCKTTKELQKALGIGNASMGSHMEAMVKANMIGLVSK